MSNPYLRPAEPAPVFESLPVDPIIGNALHVEGLSHALSVRGVAGRRPRPQPPQTTPDSVWLVGASGGVGVSTLAELGGDLLVDGGLFAPPWGASTYVVAATHPAGLSAATEFARAKARGEVAFNVLGLLLVHDRPKLSKPSLQLARSVAGLYPRTWTVPYMPAWREPGDGERVTNVRVRRVLASLMSARSNA